MKNSNFKCVWLGIILRYVKTCIGRVEIFVESGGITSGVSLAVPHGGPIERQTPARTLNPKRGRGERPLEKHLGKSHVENDRRDVGHKSKEITKRFDC